MKAGRPKLTLAEREFAFSAANIENFALRVASAAWGWKNLDNWQRAALISPSRYLMLLCSRQSGKSSILAIKALHRALFSENSLTLIVAEQRQSNEDMRKVKELARAYDAYLRKAYKDKIVLQPISDNVTSLELGSNSRVVALPANEKVRGFSAPDMVIMDEAAYQPDETFVAIDPMMTVSQGQFVLASTPNGNSGFFYTEHKNPRYEIIEAPWWECPRIPKEDIENKRLIYGDAYVKQEYECAFLDDVAALFTERSLRESVDSDEAVFSDEMAHINRVLTGEERLV